MHPVSIGQVRGCTCPQVVGSAVKDDKGPQSLRRVSYEVFSFALAPAQQASTKASVCDNSTTSCLAGCTVWTLVKNMAG